MDDPFEELRSLTFADWDEAYEHLGFDHDLPLGRIVLQILMVLATTVDQWLSVYSYARDAASIERAAEQIRLLAHTCDDLRNVIFATSADAPLRAWAVERFERTAATFAEWHALVPIPVPDRKPEAFQTRAIIHLIRLATTFDEWDAVRVTTQFAEPQLSRNALEMMANCADSCPMAADCNDGSGEGGFSGGQTGARLSATDGSSGQALKELPDCHYGRNVRNGGTNHESGGADHSCCYEHHAWRSGSIDFSHIG